jgi:hypothetical protein
MWKKKKWSVEAQIFYNLGSSFDWQNYYVFKKGQPFPTSLLGKWTSKTTPIPPLWGGLSPKKMVK